MDSDNIAKILEMVDKKTIGGIDYRLKEIFKQQKPNNYFAALNLVEQFAGDSGVNDYQLLSKKSLKGEGNLLKEEKIERIENLR